MTFWTCDETNASETHCVDDEKATQTTYTGRERLQVSHGSCVPCNENVVTVLGARHLRDVKVGVHGCFRNCLKIGRFPNL